MKKRYGSQDAAAHFLKSFENGADVLPALQRLIWLGYDNHTIVSAGATLIQLKNSKGIPFLSLKPTMRISDYLQAITTGKEIEGETPIEFVAKKVEEARESLKEAKMAAQSASMRLEEVYRIVNDAEAVLLTAEYYSNKLKALRAWTLLGIGIEIEKNKKKFINYLKASVENFEK